MFDRIPPWAIDLILTVFVLLGTVGNRVNDGQNRVVGAVAIVVSALVYFRRARPLALLALLSAANLGIAVAGQAPLTAATAILALTVAERLPRSQSLRAAGAALLVFGVALLVVDTNPARAIPSLLAVAALYALGDSVRARRDRIADESAQAVAAERARIARELHDMVTHNVSVMVVQAAAGNDVFDERPDQARAALLAVEETGRRALGELRRLLAVVTSEDEAAYDPQPGLSRLDTLVASVRATGIGVDLTIEGTPRELPPALELSAYRIVQESLTNTLKHAGATQASVRVSFDDEALELEIADDGVGSASTDGGRGLVGMRERVAMFGGDLAAGARPGGGFAVRARMPVEAS